MAKRRLVTIVRNIHRDRSAFAAVRLGYGISHYWQSVLAIFAREHRGLVTRSSSQKQRDGFPARCLQKETVTIGEIVPTFCSSTDGRSQRVNRKSIAVICDCTAR